MTQQIPHAQIARRSAGALTQALAPQAPEARARPTDRANRLVRLAVILFAASIPVEGVPVASSLGLARPFGLFLAASALTQPNWALRRPVAAFWMFALYMLIAFVGAVPYLDWYASTIQMRGLTLAQNLIMFWILSNVLRDDDLTGRALTAMAIAGAVVAAFMALGFMQTTVETARGVRISFAGVNPNALGGVLSLCLLALLGMMLTAQLTGRVWRWLAPAMAAPVLGAIIRTGSRGALAGLFAGLVVLAFSGERTTKRFRNVVLLIGAGAAAYFALYVTSITQLRWGEALEKREVSGRERIYPELLRMIGERPLQGWGMQNNRVELGQRVPRLVEGALDAHNLYLHVITEVGVVGSLPFWFALFLCVRSAHLARRSRHGLLPLVLVAAALVTNMVTTGILTKPLWFVLAYATAGGAVAVTERRAARAARVRQETQQAVASARAG